MKEIRMTEWMGMNEVNSYEWMNEGKIRLTDWISMNEVNWDDWMNGYEWSELGWLNEWV